MRERQPGVWELRVYRGQLNGRKQWASRTFRGGERAAAKALAALEVELDGLPLTPTAGLTVRQLLHQYVTSRSPNWSPNTRHDHPRVIELWILPELGDRVAEDVRVRDVERLVDRIADSGKVSTARKVLAILRSAYEDGIRWEVVDRNPARSARPPERQPARSSTAAFDAVRRVIAAAPPDMALLIRLAVVTGARRGELLGLQWGDLANGTLVVSRSVVGRAGRLTVKGTKTGTVKVMALLEPTVAAWDEWRTACEADARELGITLRPDGFVFAQRPDGREPRWPDGISHRWRELADAHGLAGVRLHDLRHTMVTTLISEGVDVSTVAGRSGHSQPSVLLGTYAHAVPARDAEAAAILERELAG